MGEFSWEDIDSSAYMSASGPTGSVQFRAGDEDSQSKLSGSSRLTYNTSSNFLEFQGDLNVTGNVHADGAVTEISSSNLIITDPVFGLGFGTGSVQTGTLGDRGFVFGLAGNNNQALLWDQSSGSFVLGGVGGTGPTQTAFDIPFGNLGILRLGNLKFVQDLSGSGRLFGAGIETSGHLGVSGSIKNGSFISSSGEVFGASLRSSGNSSVSGTIIVSGNVHIADDTKLYFGTNEDAFIEYVTDDGVVDALSISGSISRGTELSGTAIFVDADTITTGSLAGPTSRVALSTTSNMILTGVVALLPGGTNTNVQFNDGGTEMGGSNNFTFTALGGLVKIVGNVSGSGFIHASSLSTSGKVNITGSLSGAAELFGGALRTSGQLDATGSVKNKSFISSSGEVFGTSLKTSGAVLATGSVSSAAITTTNALLASSLSSLSVGDLSSSARLFGQGIETSGHLGVTGSIKNGSFISSSNEIYGTSFRSSGDIQVTGAIRNGSFVSSSGEIFGAALRTSSELRTSGSIKSLSVISSSNEVRGGSFETSGDVLVTGSIKSLVNAAIFPPPSESFISSSGEIFGESLRTSKLLSVSGSTILKGETRIMDDLVVEDDVMLTGSLTVMSGAILATTKKVFETDGEDGAILQGRTRGKFIQLFPSNVVMGNTSQANSGRFMGLNQGGESGGLQPGITYRGVLLMPFAGRLIKLVYRMGSTNGLSDQSPMRLEFYVGNGEPPGTNAEAVNAGTMIGQATASAKDPADGGVSSLDVVGEIDVTDPYQTTGSFAFGTGSHIGIKILTAGTTRPGDCLLTAVMELDTGDLYVSGSGN